MQSNMQNAKDDFVKAVVCGWRIVSVRDVMRLARHYKVAMNVQESIAIVRRLCAQGYLYKIPRGNPYQPQDYEVMGGKR